MIFIRVFVLVNRLLMRLQENGSRSRRRSRRGHAGRGEVMTRDVRLCRQMRRLDIVAVAQAAAQVEDLAVGGFEGLL